MRAKLIDGAFTLPPNPIPDGAIVIHDPSDATLARLGWKVVVDESEPEHTGETHCERAYRETEFTIIRSWAIIEDDATTKCARRREWFDNNYDQWVAKANRLERLGLPFEEIVDEFRNKTYVSLSELDAEAEVVRAEINAMENQNE